jgi:hypothetical protein
MDVAAGVGVAVGVGEPVAVLCPDAVADVAL